MAATEGFAVTLNGSSGGQTGVAGYGAVVYGIVDYQRLRRLPGYRGVWSRIVNNGSASIVAEQVINDVSSYTWIAVAAGGGFGTTVKGGDAGSAVEIGVQGSSGVRTHAYSVSSGGGGGGGRGSVAGVGFGATSAEDGIQLPTTDVGFITGLQSTGGGNGGDGYYGGGGGLSAGKPGGGGGSYVSPYITEVNTYTRLSIGPASVTALPLLRLTQPPPKFNVRIWLTRYNQLRIYGGRAALTFAE